MLIWHISTRIYRILDANAALIAICVGAAMFGAITARRIDTPPESENREVNIPALDPTPNLLATGQSFFRSGDFRTAVSCFSDVISSERTQAEGIAALINRAVSNSQLRHYSDALDDLSHASRMIAGIPELAKWKYDVQLRIAQIQFLNDKQQAAIFALGRLNDECRHSTEALTLRARSYLDQSQFHDAVRDLSRLLIAEPTPSAYINRATAFHAMQNYSLALADTRRASEMLVDAEGPFVEELKSLAAVSHCVNLLAAGMHNETVTITSELLHDEIAVVQMHRIRAAALRILGNDEEALIDERLAVGAQEADGSRQRNDWSPPVFSTDSEHESFPTCRSFTRGIFTVSPQLVTASPTEIPDEDSSNVSGLVQAAMEQVADNNPGDAVATLEKYLKVFPRDGDARIRRAAILLDMNDVSESSRDLAALMETNDQDLTVHSLRGLAFFRTGEFDAAIDAFSRVIRLSEQIPNGYFNRGTAYFAKEEWGLAAYDLQRAVLHGDDSPTALSWLGRALAKDGHFPEAIDSHNRAISAEPSATAFKFRGLTFSESGKEEEALKDFSAALATAPNDVNLLELRTQLLLHAERYEEALLDAKSLADLRDDDLMTIELVKRLEHQIARQKKANDRPKE